MSLIKSFLNLFGEHNLNKTMKAELDQEDPEDAAEIIRRYEQRLKNKEPFFQAVQDEKVS